MLPRRQGFSGEKCQAGKLEQGVKPQPSHGEEQFWAQHDAAIRICPPGTQAWVPGRGRLQVETARAIFTKIFETRKIQVTRILESPLVPWICFARKGRPASPVCWEWCSLAWQWPSDPIGTVSLQGVPILLRSPSYQPSLLLTLYPAVDFSRSHGAITKSDLGEGVSFTRRTARFPEVCMGMDFKNAILGREEHNF